MNESVLCSSEKASKKEVLSSGVNQGLQNFHTPAIKMIPFQDSSYAFLNCLKLD